MANTQSQAQQIKDLLLERIESYDPTIDTAQGSAFYTQVIAPVFAAMGTDPFDTDVEEFLLTRLRQEFPSIPAENGDAIVDLLIRPLQLLLESFKRELQIIRTGQSVTNADQMRLEDAEDLAANFFVTRRQGSRSSGIARVYFRQPTFVTVPATATFTSSAGLLYYPSTPQFFRPETVAVQRSGDQYYVDVSIIAETEGAEYNIPAGDLVSVSGVSGASRVTNLFEFGGGSESESASELLQRTQSSLTERSLNTRRGIRARLFSDYPALRNVEIAGYGDPEMQRDKITGGGGMDNLCSGMCFIVGRYAMLFSMFENKGPTGDRFLREGGVLELNFWKFLYNVPRERAIQRFGVEEVIYASNEDLVDIPTVYLIKLDAAPDVAIPAPSTLPGVLPGVFFTAYTKAVLTISGIPGGITNPDAEGRILIEDDSVHIGGHYDVYLRPSSSNSTSTTLEISRGEVALHEGVDLVLSGDIPNSELVSLGALKNKVHARLRLNIVPTAGSFTEGEIVRMVLPSGTEQEDTSAHLLSYSAANKYCDLACLSSDTTWAAGNTVKGMTSGALGYIHSVDSVQWADLGVTRGMTLNIISGPDAGIYKILEVRGPELVLDLEMTVLGQEFRFRITDESVVDVFSPKAQLFPFAGESATDLDTVVGSTTVRVSRNLGTYGVVAGDTLEILDGDNKGTYTISGFDEVYGTKAPVLNRPMRSTDSSLSYVVYRAATGLSAPLVRIQPEGITAQDISGQTTGFTIPPSEAVGARALRSFSGARASYLGLNGFVLPDPGPTWMPSSDVVVDMDALDPATLAYIEQYYGKPSDCYSNGCEEYEDAFIAVISIADMPTGSGGHDVRVHLDIDLPTEATDFLQTLRAWLVSVIDSFGLGDDFRSFIDLFSPISFDAPDTASWNIIAQYEVLIPKEIFDGCNNVFVALPEYNWENEFSSDTTFSDAIDKYNNGELRGGKSALSKALPGSALTILTGANAGSYVIRKVYKYTLVNGGSINTSDTVVTSDDYIDPTKTVELVLVCIDDSFPVEPFSGLAEYFSSPKGSTALALPTPPVFNVESIVTSGADAGTVLGPWEVVQQSVTWLFQFLTSVGFDVPEEFTVNPDSVLKKLTQTLFSQYVVGNTTGEQLVRMSFLEPTSVTVYGNRPCKSFTWYETDTTAASVTSAAVTLPLSLASGLPITLVLKSLAATETLEKTVTASIASETDADLLVAALQDLLDPDVLKVRVSQVTTGPTVELTFTTIAEGADASIRVVAADAADALYQMGFSAEDGITHEGTSSAGQSHFEFLRPPAPTLFTAVAGTAELLFCATGTEEPFQVFPGGGSSGRAAASDLPRDVAIGAHYSGAKGFLVRFTDFSYDAPLMSGVRTGEDVLRVYEQRTCLAVAGSGSEAVSEKQDRVVAVATVAGSNTLSLPALTYGSAEFTFLAASSGLEMDEIVPGDLLFIEEGDDAGGYRVVSVSDTAITLDRSLSTSTAQIYKSGNGGSIDAGTTFVDLEAPFSVTDVGKYLTISLSSYPGVDGSYEITAVTDSSTVELSVPAGAFPVTEVGIHWAVVSAPIDDLDASSVDGATALHGLVPIRIYNHIPTEWRVSVVHPTVNRELAYVECTYEGARYLADNPHTRNLGVGPIRGYKQPYEFVRDGTIHVSSTAMKAQGRDNGLFYFDVRAKSLGGDAVYNIPEDTALTPVFGTYSADGYRFEVEDSLYTYSARESSKLYFSPRFLPAELDDSEANKVSIEGISLTVEHDYSALVGGIQNLLLSDSNRVLCADPLARHFLPSYVYFDVEAVGGSAAMGFDIADYINSLEPQDPLDVSILEKFLHGKDVVSYSHPLTLQIVTHDLDRKAVLTRTHDRIGGPNDEADFHGSHRTTFYIPGEVVTSSADADIPVGERIYIKRR